MQTQKKKNQKKKPPPESSSSLFESGAGVGVPGLVFLLSLGMILSGPTGTRFRSSGFGSTGSITGVGIY